MSTEQSVAIYSIYDKAMRERAIRRRDGASITRISGNEQQRNAPIHLWIFTVALKFPVLAKTTEIMLSNLITLINFC